MSQTKQIADIAATRDRLRAEADSLDEILQRMIDDDVASERALARYDLGDVWGATKLALRLGVSRNTGYKMMKTDMAAFSWTDSDGRLRVNAADVDTWLAGRTVHLTPVASAA